MANGKAKKWLKNQRNKNKFTKTASTMMLGGGMGKVVDNEFSVKQLGHDLKEKKNKNLGTRLLWGAGMGYAIDNIFKDDKEEDTREAEAEKRLSPLELYANETSSRLSNGYLADKEVKGVTDSVSESSDLQRKKMKNMSDIYGMSNEGRLAANNKINKSQGAYMGQVARGGDAWRDSVVNERLKVLSDIYGMRQNAMNEIAITDANNAFQIQAQKNANADAAFNAASNAAGSVNWGGKGNAGANTGANTSGGSGGGAMEYQQQSSYGKY